MTKIVTPVKQGEDDAESELLTGEPLPITLWPHQREVLELMLTRRRIVVLKARQLGLTWVMAIYALWYAISHEAAEVVIVSVGEREARTVNKRIKFLYKHLPETVRAAFPIAAESMETIVFQHAGGNTTISSLPSSSTAGRGETVNVLILDEGAHWENADERLGSLLPTTEDLGQLIFASTANGVGGAFYDTWEHGEDRGYARLFAGATARPDRDEAWVLAARERVGSLGVQEYPMTPAEAFLATGRCAFLTRALQDYLDNRVRPPARIGRIEVNGRSVEWVNDKDGGWRVWDFAREGRSYLITADVCGGQGGDDFSAAAVYDLTSWDQVASYHGRPEPDVFATLLIRAGWMWRGPVTAALLAPELNDHGRATMTVLRERGYPNLWAMQRFDQRRDERTVQHGWLTTSMSRPIALAALKEGVREGTIGIADRATIGEMLVFQVDPKTGKEQARPGANDDRVMTHAIAAVILQREASGARPRDVKPEDLMPYRSAQESRTGY